MSDLSLVQTLKIMTLTITLVTVLLAITKLLDSFTTYVKIQDAGGEQNPMANKLMRKVGVGPAIIVFTLLAFVVIGISATVAYSSSFVAQVGFIGLGVIISVVQVAVAHNNWTGKRSVITKFVSKFYSTIRK